MLGGEVLFLVGVPILAILTISRIRAGVPWPIALAWVGIGLYALAAVDRLFFPLGLESSVREQNLNWLAAATPVNWTPFNTISDLLARSSTTQAVRQIGGNIGLLLPLGLALPAVEPRLRSLPRMVLVALLATVCIESVQYATTQAGIITRSFDVDDLSLNLAGALIGYFLWSRGSRYFVRTSRVKTATWEGGGFSHEPTSHAPRRTDARKGRG